MSSLNEDSGRDLPISSRTGMITVGIMSMLVFLFVPWQVAFLACYIIHFNHCALLVAHSDSATSAGDRARDATNQRLLILLIMTWCLPAVAPVLAVWVRTLFTAGLTTPFDGDHNPLNVLSFVALTYFATSLRGPLISRRHRCVLNTISDFQRADAITAMIDSRELVSVPVIFLVSSFVSFMLGPRATYRMYEALNWPVSALLVFRVAPSFFLFV